MALAYSKLTSQAQISVPAAVRKKLGIGPGAVLEWDIEDGRIVVRRAGLYSSEDIHKAVFPKPPKPKTLDDMKQGIRKHVRRKHARR